MVSAEPVQCSSVMQPNERGCHLKVGIEVGAKRREQASLHARDNIVRSDRLPHVRNLTGQQYLLYVDARSLLSLRRHRVLQIKWQAPARIEGCQGEVIGKNQWSKDSNVVVYGLRILASGCEYVNSSGIEQSPVRQRPVF